MVELGMMDGFEAATVDIRDVRIFIRRAGSGLPVLFLHGFPETHLMWRGVAPLLAGAFTVICADLPGYGDSSCPDSTSDHASHSKRTMAGNMANMMEGLGFPRFSVVGHDRGGRVAYRMALDHPERVTRLAVLDIVPTADAWQRADARLALAFWPWSLLAQPAPLPERILTAAAEAVVDDALSQWGSASGAFPPEVRAAYVGMLRDPAHAHAICEEYRAAATLDRAHDAADRRAGRRIACPLLALWSAKGALGTWYTDEGGPLALWSQWADDVWGEPMEGGHFFPEEAPEQTAALLAGFLAVKPA